MPTAQSLVFVAAANPTLKWGFIIVMGLLALLFIRDGWKQGWPRKMMTLLGLGLAIFCGVNFRDWAGEQLAQYIPFPAYLLSYPGGILLGFVIFIVSDLSGRLFFRPTTKQEGFKRSLYGWGGAALGALLAAAILFFITYGIQTLGHLSAIFLNHYQNRASDTAEAENNTTQTTKQAAALIGWVVDLSHSIEEIPGGDSLLGVELVPEENFRILDKTLSVLETPEASTRMLEQPGVRELLESPHLSTVTQDEEIKILAQKQDIKGLLKNPKIRALLENEAFQKELGAFDLENALDEALKAEK